PASAFADIQVVLKTGFAETDNKLLTHLRTVTSIVPASSLLIFSDAASQTAGHQIIDILSSFPPAYRAANPEFSTYSAQKQAQADGRTLEPSHSGWLLDKHKFLPMLSKTWALRPDKKFYVFAEADTFVFWENMLGFLAQLDGADELYLGHGIDAGLEGHAPFAYGGSGYVLSAGAMRAMMRGEEEAFGEPGTHAFGRDMRGECCGDAVLGDVLAEKGIGLRGYWPLINGQSLEDLVLGGDGGLWCEPVLSLHHLAEWEMESLWHWTTTSNEAKPNPLLYTNLLHYLLPRFNASDHDWQNNNRQPIPHVYDIVPDDDDDVSSTAHACEALCRANDHCFHWQFDDDNKRCSISRSIQLGEPRGKFAENVAQKRSGFDVDHIE
ncbi:glycosyltransferase family 31 protein, partial [Saccharata proteae CBS 121410]